MEPNNIHLFRVIITVLVLVNASSCTTTSITQKAYDPPKVVDRIGSVQVTPEWASGAQPFFEEAGQVTFVNTLSMSGDSRPEACNNAAADSGRAQILRQVKDHLTTSGQLSDASASSDPGVESLMAFLSQGKLSGVKITGRYWERREESDAGAKRVLRLFCATKVSIAKGLLEEQLRAAISGSGNPEIRQKLLDAQKGFLESIGDEAAGSH